MQSFPLTDKFSVFPSLIRWLNERCGGQVVSVFAISPVFDSRHRVVGGAADHSVNTVQIM